MPELPEDPLLPELPLDPDVPLVPDVPTPLVPELPEVPDDPAPPIVATTKPVWLDGKYTFRLFSSIVSISLGITTYPPLLYTVTAGYLSPNW